MAEIDFTTEELEREEWRTIPETEGRYSVSSLGRIRRDKPGASAKEGCMRKLCPDTAGYPSISLFVNGKQKNFAVYRIVARVFLGPRPDGCEINHIDANKLNSRVTNLEYVTHSENMNHAYRLCLIRTTKGEKNPGAKLKEEEVIDVRQRYARGESSSIIAKHYGIAAYTVRLIAGRKLWKHLQ